MVFMLAFVANAFKNVIIDFEQKVIGLILMMLLLSHAHFNQRCFGLFKDCDFSRTDGTHRHLSLMTLG